MQKLLLLFIAVCSVGIASGQSISTYLISSTGASIMGQDGGMYISVGEPLSTEIQEGDIMISQGFLQVTTTNRSVSTQNLLEESITAYPNPTSANLTLHMPDSNGTYKVQITGSNGNLVKSVIISDVENLIDFSDMIQGTYFLNAIKGDKQSESLRILKIK